MLTMETLQPLLAEVPANPPVRTSDTALMLDALHCMMQRISQLGSRSDLILRICRDHIKNSKCGVGGGQEDSNDDKVFGGRSSNEM